MLWGGCLHQARTLRLCDDQYQQISVTSSAAVSISRRSNLVETTALKMHKTSALTCLTTLRVAKDHCYFMSSLTLFISEVLDAGSSKPSSMLLCDGRASAQQTPEWLSKEIAEVLSTLSRPSQLLALQCSTVIVCHNSHMHTKHLT